MDRSGLLALPDGADTSARMRAYFEADPVALVEVAAAIAHGGGREPVVAVSRAARDASAGIANADPRRLRAAMEEMLLGRDVDLALEWVHAIGVLGIVLPELEATVDLVQESGRLHKDVWAHTKLVVKQAVRRPMVRWAALLHDIGKVPTRTFTRDGVHFHGHAEVGARMFDRIHERFGLARDERQTIRFLIKHHLRTNAYGTHWTDSAVRRFHREMGPHMVDLLDLSRADITSKRPGRRQQLLAQISALADRAVTLAEADARLPPLPGGVGNAIMDAFRIAPGRIIGDLKRSLEVAIASGELEPRREDAYYVAYLARNNFVPGADPEIVASLVAQGGLDGEAATVAGDDVEGPHRGVEPDDHDGDPERPHPGVLACGHDPDDDPCTATGAYDDGAGDGGSTLK